MEELKLHVERIVRPIRATAWRKNKMREELLGHLTQKAESLIATGAGEAEAAAGAMGQLGDTDALRAELQSSVPAVERLAFSPLAGGVLDSYFEKTEGQSGVRYALAHTAVIASVIVAASVVVWSAGSLGMWNGSREKIHSAYCLGMLALAASSAIVASFVVHYAIDLVGLRRILSKKTQKPALVKGAAYMLFMCAYFFAMFAPLLAVLHAVNPGDAATLIAVFTGTYGLGLPIGAVVFLAVTLIVTTAAMKYEQEQWAKWGRLRINDE